MAYEIEIKAHASEALKEKIDELVGTAGEPVVKEDIYYAFPEDVTPRFRIRRENNRLLISAKRNHRQQGLECNEELEFYHENVSDQETMEAMARMLGYSVFIHKGKRGYGWMYGDVHIELLDVRHLGWYLEMEVISPVSGIEENRKHYEDLFKVLYALGLSDDDVESRSYQEMLRPFEPRA